MDTNLLYYGDNLEVLRRYVPDASVDLIYLDPPFNSNATYNVLFAEQDRTKSAAQVKAFTDTWHWDETAARSYREAVESGGHLAQAMLAFHQLVGESDVLAYLAMMGPRLLELHRVLNPSGSIYLHCDPTASHYLKLMMDAVFGTTQFRNEIIWAYRGGGTPRKDFGRRHDVLLRYSKTDTYTFYPDAVRMPYQAEGLARKDDAMWGRHKGTDKVYKPNPLGKVPEDWWLINVLNANDPRRMGYPTQKPDPLLERIIKASSQEGDVILDPFCGCGTSVYVAQNLNRRWIGIDITHLAINLIRHSLTDAFGSRAVYTVLGEPKDVASARALADQNKYQFQWWALGLVGARPVASDQKKGADRGIDGRLYFHDSGTAGKTKQVIFSVKGGHTNVGDLRDLRGVLDREKAEIGVLITLQEATQPMRTEAASSGFYESPWGVHQRLQVRTIAELLAGKGIDMPAPGQTNTTYRQAPRAKGVNGLAQAGLGLAEAE